MLDYVHSLAPPLYLAPDDYANISQAVTFSSAPSQMCVPVSISDDGLVEEDEFFTVSLESTDPDVNITQPSANFTIIDSTSKSRSSLHTLKPQNRLCVAVQHM